MKEYYGSSASVYQQTDGKKYLLIPAIQRNIPRAKTKKSVLLDIACGNGDLYPLISQKGYQYIGLDISPDMIHRAKFDYPQGSYIISPATRFTSKLKQKVDIALICMLFPSFNEKVDIINTLTESKKALKKGGKIIIGVSHPNFDCYMRKGLFNVDYVDAVFTGYFSSASPMAIHKNFDNGRLTFEDFHWTLQDYVECITKSGLSIIKIDECPPTNSPIKFSVEKQKYPTYLLFICE